MNPIFFGADPVQKGVPDTPYLSRMSLVCLFYHCIFILDINECTSGQDRCHGYASCRDTIGSYTCSCRSGYTGNGYSCTSKNKSFLSQCDYHV